MEPPQLSLHTGKNRSARPLAADFTTGSPHSVTRASKILTPGRPSAIVTSILRDLFSLPDVNSIPSNGTGPRRPTCSKGGSV